MTVRDLLEASMRAHNAAKPRAHGKRPTGWKESLGEACRLRVEALEMDPKMSDPCWSEFGRHEQMMGFYSDVGGL